MLVEPWRKLDLALSPKAGDPTLFFHTEDRATLAQWALLLAKERQGTSRHDLSLTAPAGTAFAGPSPPGLRRSPVLRQSAGTPAQQNV
jgi:hypothetical protein